ncbi:aldehyde dehydrogenase (NAD+) [Rhizobium pisi]|uniref:Aldehyde dehydrogenase (NAD+) n=1 Tax=Rhizobium pisi TaxID=574561 RepID=A0A427MX81_9HYPH|nr:aldehyde dehydrogenase family protein [Rhizobium pisi]MBB3135899.1 aldehyde dehydrogenase (NAD+) [Rhizobium pisi]RSB75773.1 aldehyde dehydrogenase family protein [Rhizobium pisi]TCA49384.1 aldehyde dehydrogenase family protein [Rhizobium pisi]
MQSDNALKFYIDGRWVMPSGADRMDVINPANEHPFMQIAIGTIEDADLAVQAAFEAFPTFSQTSKSERLELLRNVLRCYNDRYEDIAQAVSTELGAPLKFSREAQAWAGQIHLESTIEALEAFSFDEHNGSSMITWEPIGVCALITPWNWPLNQIVCKVAPALAAGCTVVLKPSELAPLSAMIFAEVLEEAGVPKGVFNLINGTGPVVGQYLAGHPRVDMVSFTGSTRAGIIVAKTAAETVKRVAQELGGKSANIVLADADLEDAVIKGVEACFSNSGQSCDAPTRLLVPAKRHAEALEIAKRAAAATRVGDPLSENTDMGPVISQQQFDKIQGLIGVGVEEGAILVAGGLGKPEGLDIGYYAKPTIFGGVTPEMTIAREEIFGPVLSIIPYDTEADAVGIANDSIYGLAAYVQGGNLERARAVARKLRAGAVYVNYAPWDTHAPFGGYKQSGNGREYSHWGIRDFMEVKGIVGWGA